jgi:hypothetical protein
MREAYESTLEEATGGAAIVLRDRKLMIKEELAKMGVTPVKSSRQFDAQGGRAGRSAADRSIINQGIGGSN